MSAIPSFLRVELCMAGTPNLHTLFQDVINPPRAARVVPCSSIIFIGPSEGQLPDTSRVRRAQVLSNPAEKYYLRSRWPWKLCKQATTGRAPLVLLTCIRVRIKPWRALLIFEVSGIRPTKKQCLYRAQR